jgi:hypothetical protein
MKPHNTKTIRSEIGRIVRGGSSVVGARAMRIVVSSGEVARDGLALNQYKWNLPRSGKCPLLDSHRDGSGIRCVLGSVDGFEVRTIDLESGRSGAALLGVAHFAERTVSEDAEIALALYRAGHATAFSVSFIPIWGDSNDPRTPSGQTLLEVSCVAVGADENSVALARALRNQLNGECNAIDRAALARAISNRVALDDSNARGETAADRARATRARIIRAQGFRDETP